MKPINMSKLTPMSINSAIIPKDRFALIKIVRIKFEIRKHINANPIINPCAWVSRLFLYINKNMNAIAIS